jgi:hypothetical protein
MPVDTSVHTCDIPGDIPAAQATLPPKYLTVQFPLRYNWRQLAYTDGSFIEPKRKGSKEGAVDSQPPES